MFLSCRPFVVITTFSTGLVGVEVTSVSWLGQMMPLFANSGLGQLNVSDFLKLFYPLNFLHKYIFLQISHEKFVGAAGNYNF